MTPNRLNRYISQMEAHRRRHTVSITTDEAQRLMERGLLHYTDEGWTLGDVWAPYRTASADDQYAWANLDPLKYGGSEQEDYP